MATVARAAKLPLADLLAISPSRSDLVAILLRETVRETARRYRPERGRQTARERVFDVAMTWFEQQKSRRKAIANLVRGVAKEPLVLLSLRTEILRLSETLLALAETDGGSLPSVRAAGFAAVIARAIPVWLDDESELDLTMARIDRDLRRFERLL